jgi:hypothetical protein
LVDPSEVNVSCIPLNQVITAHEVWLPQDVVYSAPSVEILGCPSSSLHYTLWQNDLLQTVVVREVYPLNKRCSVKSETTRRHQQINS